MSLWGNVDNAANSVISVTQQHNQATTTGNRANLFNNVTTSAVTTNVAVGVFGVSEAETANTVGEGSKVAHAGWVIRTEGTGGRAGRVHMETLVAMSSISGDSATDDVNSANSNTTIFTE